MAYRRYLVPVLTDAGGAADSTSGVIAGRIQAIRYIKNATIPYASGVDFVITNETTGETLWSELNVNATVVKRIRLPTHDSAGVAALYAAGFPVLDCPALARDRVRIVISNGGDSKLGVFQIVVEG